MGEDLLHKKIRESQLVEESSKSFPTASSLTFLSKLHQDLELILSKVLKEWRSERILHQRPKNSFVDATKTWTMPLRV